MNNEGNEYGKMDKKERDDYFYLVHLEKIGTRKRLLKALLDD
jgi:hypothetical protein